MLAGVTNTPELVLMPNEAQALAQNLENVSLHYGSVLTQEQLDTFLLGACILTIYGTRFIAIRNRLHRLPQSKPPNTNSAPPIKSQSSPTPPTPPNPQNARSNSPQPMPAAARGMNGSSMTDKAISLSIDPFVQADLINALGGIIDD